MARSVPAVLALGLLVVAAFCMSEASAMNTKKLVVPGQILLHVKLFDNCGHDVRLVLEGKVLDCKKGKHSALGPLKVRLDLLDLLDLELHVFDKNGKLLKVKAFVRVDLGLLGELLGDVTELVLEVVEELLGGGKGTLIKVLGGHRRESLCSLWL